MKTINDALAEAAQEFCRSRDGVTYGIVEEPDTAESFPHPPRAHRHPALHSLNVQDCSSKRRHIEEALNLL
jgi:hypothetical protein